MYTMLLLQSVLRIKEPLPFKVICFQQFVAKFINQAPLYIMSSYLCQFSMRNNLNLYIIKYFMYYLTSLYMSCIGLLFLVLHLAKQVKNFQHPFT